MFYLQHMKEVTATLNTQIKSERNKLELLQLERDNDVFALNTALHLLRKQEDDRLVIKDEIHNDQAHLKHGLDEAEKANGEQKVMQDI